mmetsp:Transcript_12858/g.22304  ORF Transcript_12858/g.22304 Transcript_12858/m.22304 type:complete len:206 (+) Transcript_12858:328-945(+)
MDGQTRLDTLRHCQIFVEVLCRLVFASLVLRNSIGCHRMAHGIVSGQIAAAGQNQIPHPCESGDGRGFAAFLHHQTGHLCEASRDQGGPRVGAEAEAVGGAAGDGQDVLQRAAELRADDVRGRVDAEVPRGQGHLDLLGHLRVMRSTGDTGGQANSDLFGKRRATDHGQFCVVLSRQFVHKDFVWSSQTLFLDTFAAADQRDPPG